MSSLLSWYHYVNTELADHRTKDWILINSPTILVLAIFSYLYFVLRCGPRYMENRKPYSLKTVIWFYNVFQIIVNAVIMYHILASPIAWYRNYFFYCQPVDYSVNPTTMKVATISWYVLLIKLCDYVETGFFVLRKKQRQVSFLHLYHHVSTVIIAWLAAKYSINGMAMTVPLVNCGVHVIMYTYYLASSFGPTVQRYLNHIKPFITMIQMIQFIILMVYVMQGLMPGCAEVKFMSGTLLVNLIINFYLFYDFYQNTYKKKSKQS